MKANAKQMSFSAASVFPAKLLKMKVIDDKGRVMPIHLQINPTNVCNFNCPFCSCANRNKGLQLSYEDHKEILEKAVKHGCKSVTITGGGEPLMHPKISEIIKLCSNLGIKVGLVSNGMLLSKLNREDMERITWCRISSSDYLEENLKTINKTLDDWFNIIDGAVKIGSDVDWAFSHVLTKNARCDILAKCIDFANKHNFTHIRIVSDLLDLDNVPDMELVKKILREQLKVDDHLVIYQGRKDHVRGRKKCLISLLKPVIGPDGKIYPCCGTQYALENPSKDYEKTMNMGDAKDIDKLFEEQKFFDGSVCVKCYYEQYNYALEVITSEVKHKEFV